VTTAVPSQARVVVIGGGVIGTSVAYHLAHAGCRDIVLLEQHQLTAGTTWHSAGLMVTFGSMSETSTEFRKYTRDLYARLEAETGQATGLRQCGFIECAIDEGRLEEYRRVSAFNRYCGVDVQEISAKEVGDLFPIARTDDILAGFYVKDDGRVDPVNVTMALAKGARMQGARIIEGVKATGVIVADGGVGAAGGGAKGGRRVTGVRTSHGDIACEMVINCGGAWGREIGLQAGVTIPLQAAEHYYLITEEIPGISRSWPVLEDPASFGYFREEGGGLMIGLFEALCAPWRVEGMPDDFAFGEIPPDWERMGPYLETAMQRVPISMQTGVKKFFCGPESFTPDLKPCLGEAPELKNYFVAAGLNSIGILTGGGVGRAMAHWMLNGRPDVDITTFNLDRLHPYQATPEYRRTRTVESLGLVYQCHYPNREMTTARDAILGPLHDRLVARGAYMRDVSGWESPGWYTLDGSRAEREPLTFGRPRSWESWKAEHEACRTGVILMDMSFMSKFRVTGRDAGRVLNWISANDVDGPAGRTTYTQWLNEGGTLEADLTVTKLGPEEYIVVASDTCHRHVQTWMERHTPPDADCATTDITTAFAQLNIQGPGSRELMQRVFGASADLSGAAFPYRAAGWVVIGATRVLLVRITYLGELGYELYIPAAEAVAVYDAIVEAGKTVGLKHAGLKSLASLRMEKAYRDYGHYIDNTDSPLEVGLGFAVDLRKPGGFVGKDAVLAKKAAGIKKKLVQVLLADPEPLMYQGEVVWREGKRMGYVRAASYGHTLGGAVGLAFIEHADAPIDQAWLDAGKWEVEIAGARHAARCSLKPMYDPAMERIRG
jgi:glycine cleavage system aminomethyltransferase T/glycine/D-amino acid oxidase-like deaminating enzyme